MAWHQTGAKPLAESMMNHFKDALPQDLSYNIHGFKMPTNFASFFYQN